MDFDLHHAPAQNMKLKNCSNDVIWVSSISGACYLVSSQNTTSEKGANLATRLEKIYQPEPSLDHSIHINQSQSKCFRQMK